MRNPAADDLAAAVLHFLDLYAQIVEDHRARLAAQGQRENENYKRASAQGNPALSLPKPSRDSLSEALLNLALEEREALLLVALEGFSHAQAARILKISRTVFIARLARARLALGNPAATTPPARPRRALPSYLQLIK